MLNSSIPIPAKALATAKNSKLASFASPVKGHSFPAPVAPGIFETKGIGCGVGGDVGSGIGGAVCAGVSADVGADVGVNVSADVEVDVGAVVEDVVVVRVGAEVGVWVNVGVGMAVGVCVDVGVPGDSIPQKGSVLKAVGVSGTLAVFIIVNSCSF